MDQGGQPELILHVGGALADALLQSPQPRLLVNFGQVNGPIIPALHHARNRPARIDQPPPALNGLDVTGRLFPAARRARPPRLIFLLPIANHTGVEDDVGVQDFTRQRIGSRRSHGESHVGGDPAERAVADVFRLKVLVLLLANFDGVPEADFLKGFIPLQNALANVGPVFIRHRLLDPEDDLLLGRGQLVFVFGIGLSPLQPPTIDVTQERRVLTVGAEILDHAEEMPDAVVGQAWLVAGVRQLDQAVMQHHRVAARIDHAVIAR